MASCPRRPHGAALSALNMDRKRDGFRGPGADLATHRRLDLEARAGRLRFFLGFRSVGCPCFLSKLLRLRSECVGACVHVVCACVCVTFSLARSESFFRERCPSKASLTDDGGNSAGSHSPTCTWECTRARMCTHSHLALGHFFLQQRETEHLMKTDHFCVGGTQRARNGHRTGIAG